MKKFLLLGLVFLLLGSALFADDAKVMPQRVGRFYLAPSFLFGEKTFDSDGTRQEIPSGEGAVKAFNLGAAVEYGITSWITAAVQWAPGINLWSDVDFDFSLLGSTSSGRAFGVGDIFAGAKIQILGTEAPVKTGRVRLAFAPGVKIPLPGPDYEDENTNATNNDPVTLANIDRHVFAFGLRSYFDFIISEKFFINLYNEFIYYPVKGDIKKAGFAPYRVADGIDQINGNAGLSAMVGTLNYGDVTYGYDLTFELEPVFTHNITEDIQFSAGLPVNYKTTPGTEYDITYDEARLTSIDVPTGGMGSALLGQIKSLEAEQTHLLTLKPNVSCFFTGWALPMEFKLAYFAPLWGKNESANHTVSLQIKAYFQI